MEAEGVAICGLVEVAAVDAVPDRNVGGDVGGDELGESAH